MADAARRLDENLTDAPELMKVEEVADFLRITKTACYAMIERGQVPGVVRVGRRGVRVRRDDLRRAYGLVPSAQPTIPSPQR